MALVPEDYIGRYLPYYDQRWNRTRDRAWVRELDKSAFGLHTVVENLAFVGLVENDVAMLKMAARHAICMAHCEYWFESVMGNLPGATWHHRSFTETAFCKCVALVLDWCGSLLTPFGRQVLLDALALKGLPRLESDFKRVEYIRSMNQGIAFSQGRIFALLALQSRYPRYQSNLAEAERDLTEMIANYIQPDGGTLEGPHYWMYTFGEAVASFYALARTHGKPFTAYRPIFEKTGQYALALMSMEGDGTLILPLNDAHNNVPMSCKLANSFYQFTGAERWRTLYERLLEKQLIEDEPFALIAAVPPRGGVQKDAEQLCAAFPVTGLAGITRQGSELRTLVYLCSGPTYASHFHEDKGSLILEAEGRTLCPDPGVANYYEAELFQLSYPQAHNLLCPVYADGRLARQGRFDVGGTLLQAEVQGTAATLASRDTDAWHEAPYATVERHVYSPYPELVVVEDDFVLGKADSVQFLLNSYTEWRLDGQQATAQNGEITLRVVPLNWQWSTAAVRPLQDGGHRPLWQLAANYRAEPAARLLTAIVLEKNTSTTITAAEDGWHFTHGAEHALITAPKGC